MIEYKGYCGKVEFDDEAGIFQGDVINTRDVITFQGESVSELQQAFRDSIDDYLEFCQERGESPEKPFSGQPPSASPFPSKARVKSRAGLCRRRKQRRRGSDAALSFPFRRSPSCQLHSSLTSRLVRR